jgi:hypothetical protein
MQHAGGDGATVQSESRNEGYHSMVSELVLLIEHVQAGMKRLESAIASETAPVGEEPATGIVVLDDVTPRYATVNAALCSCNTGLGVALRVLQATADELAGRDRRLVLMAQAQGA